MATSLGEFIFGSRPKEGVPERIRTSITRQQVQSEILIGWVQLALVGFLAVLYAVSPKTSAGTPFQPVPWVLGLYIGFTVLRLALAYRGILPTGLLLASVVVDVVLLIGLIWTFHLQYRQPAAFYLKAPTLLYVFIFIALRALRFEAKYVIATGLAAAAGWLAMLFYALFDPMLMGDNITRDYVKYMTSNMILIGAEIDKVISILMVTVILAVALVRAQRLLSRAVADSQAARDLTRFVAPELANRIATSEDGVRAGVGEVRTATVMFTDIEGFSGISERLSPEGLIAALNEYFAAVARVVERFGGTITQFQGDAMLIAFNTARDDPDHAANALRTALGIQEATAEARFGDGILMRTRCGVNTGDMVSGTVGSQSRLHYTVHGDEVNIAARLEQLNKTYGTYILAAERTVDAAGPAFRRARIGEVTVRGRQAPTAVYRVDGEAPPASG